MNKRKIFLIVIFSITTIFGGYLLTMIINPKPLSVQPPINKIDPVITVDWLATNLDSSNLRLIFVGSGKDKIEIYDQGHIKNSIYLDINPWYEDKTKVGISAGIVSSKEKFEKIMGEQGISNNDVIVLYGVPSSAYIGRALWTFKYHGHENVAYLNGGITEWVEKKGKKSLTKEPPKIIPTTYKATYQENLKITADELYENLNNQNVIIIDTRTIEEYSGQKIKKAVSRGGHIPGAVNIEWYSATLNNSDETLKSKEELELIYKDIPKDKEIIVYCQTGTRSSNPFFVLKYILGYPNVRNYDGSWDEWSNAKDANGEFKYPIE